MLSLTQAAEDNNTLFFAFLLRRDRSRVALAAASRFSLLLVSSTYSLRSNLRSHPCTCAGVLARQNGASASLDFSNRSLERTKHRRRVIHPGQNNLGHSEERERSSTRSKSGRWKGRQRKDMAGERRYRKERNSTRVFIERTHISANERTSEWIHTDRERMNRLSSAWPSNASKER